MVYRANSIPEPQPTSGAGLLVLVTSFDAPSFIWESPIPGTSNFWSATSGGNSFNEFIAAFSKSFVNAYVTYSLTSWAINVAGNSNRGKWTDNGGSGVIGIGPVQSNQVQVLGKSVTMNVNTIAQQ